MGRNYEYSCKPATARVKSSETSRDLKGYLEPLTHLCTVLNNNNNNNKETLLKLHNNYLQNLKR